MSSGQKHIQRAKRKARSAKKIVTKNIPFKAIVFRSLNHTYAQIVDVKKGVTLVSGSDLKLKDGTKQERAKKVGLEIAKKALEKDIKKIVFDRAGYKYHGRVKMLADGLREGGLQF